MTRTTNSGNQNQNPAIAAARDRRGGRHHSRGVLRLVAARLAGQRHRHRVARRRHAEPAVAARLRDRAARICIPRMGDYAIWTETAEFARGNRPDFFSQSLNAAALVRLDVDTLPGARPQSRHPRVARARCDRRAGVRDSARPGTAGGHQAGRDFRPAQQQQRQRAWHRAARAWTGAVRGAADLRQHRHRPAAGLDRIRARFHAGGRRTHGPLLAVAGHRLSGGEPGSRRRAGRGARVGAPARR